MPNRFSISLFWSLASCLGMVAVPNLAIANQTPSTTPRGAITADQIASGTSLWVASEPDAAFRLINARVDIGTLRWVGDEVEVQMRWPTSPGLLKIIQEAHPKAKLSTETQFIDRERVACRPNGMLFYRVESMALTAAGKTIYRQTFDSHQARTQAEAFLKQAFASSLNSYGPDPRSLVCWAAARKCDNTPFSWPPPPNNTPLEYSDKARQMQAEYDRHFFPSCTSDAQTGSQSHGLKS